MPVRGTLLLVCRTHQSKLGLSLLVVQLVFAGHAFAEICTAFGVDCNVVSTSTCVPLCSLTLSLTLTPSHLLAHLLTHSLTHPLTHSLSHSLQADKGTTLVPTKTLVPPPLAHLYCGLPSPEWQSDHMSLVTDFSVQRRVSKNSILLSGLHKEANMVRARSKMVDSNLFEAVVNRNRKESS